MRSYLALLRGAYMIGLVYRFGFLFSIAGNIIYMSVTYFLWRSIYQNRETLHGLTFDQTYIYVALGSAVFILLKTYVDWQMSFRFTVVRIIHKLRFFSDEFQRYHYPDYPAADLCLPHRNPARDWIGDIPIQLNIGILTQLLLRLLHWFARVLYGVCLGTQYYQRDYRHRVIGRAHPLAIFPRCNPENIVVASISSNLLHPADDGRTTNFGLGNFSAHVERSNILGDCSIHTHSFVL